MNKLYAFIAIIFLSACGSPKFDGSWSGVDGAEGYGVLIQGEKVKLLQEGQNSFDCTLANEGFTAAGSLSNACGCALVEPKIQLERPQA